MTEPSPRHLMMVTLIGIVRAFGWRLESTESTEWRVSLVLLPPLATSRTERNRWPDEPEEGEEPTTGPDDIPGLLLSKSDVPPDWDVGVDTPFLGAERAD